MWMEYNAFADSDEIEDDSDEIVEYSEDNVNWNPELILHLQILMKECYMIDAQLEKLKLRNLDRVEDRLDREEEYIELCKSVHQDYQTLCTSRAILYDLLKESENGPYQYYHRSSKKDELFSFFEYHEKFIKVLDQKITKILKMNKCN